MALLGHGVLAEGIEGRVIESPVDVVDRVGYAQLTVAELISAGRV